MRLLSRSGVTTRILICALLMSVGTVRIAGADPESSPSPWLGKRFGPEQRTPLVPGETDFTRKLCRITYRIRTAAIGIKVEAALYFNPKFVPRRPASVTIEILLLNRQGVCIGQIDQSLTVVGEPVPFYFTVADDRVAAVRTYYVLHYPDDP